MENSENIVRQIRRSYIASLFKLAVLVSVVGSIAGGVFGRWDYFLVGIGILIFAAVQLFVGQYIPLRNKHDSLLNKYGDIYVEEVNKAIARYGVSKLTSTRWFDTYADEFCERNKVGAAG